MKKKEQFLTEEKFNEGLRKLLNSIGFLVLFGFFCNFLILTIFLFKLSK